MVKFFPRAGRLERYREQERNLHRLLRPVALGTNYGEPYVKAWTTEGHDVPEEFVARYDQPFQRMLRRIDERHCADWRCTLSGGLGHVGRCLPCGCEDKHALDECPIVYKAR